MYFSSVFSDVYRPLGAIQKDMKGKYLMDTKDDKKVVCLVCGKRCLNQYERPLLFVKDEKRGKCWDNDNFEDGPSSVDVLIGWLTDQTNTEKYFGAEESADNSGVTKAKLCGGIAKEINRVVKGASRTGDSVRSKIDALISSFKSTTDWIHNTGEGGGLEDSEESFRDMVKKRCKYYYKLEPVLGERPSIRPAFTTDDQSVDVDNNNTDNDSDFSPSHNAPSSADCVSSSGIDRKNFPPQILQEANVLRGEDEHHQQTLSLLVMIGALIIWQSIWKQRANIII